MAELTIMAGSALIGEVLTGPITISVSAGRISDIAPGRESREPDATTIDASDAVVVPGLIDIHTHGADGVQFIDGNPADLDRLSSFYAEHGVTGYLATIGGSRKHILAGIAAVRAHLRTTAPPGARCLGIHLEGPFISPEALGAFQPSSVAPADVGLLGDFVELAGGHLKLITVAPEIPGAAELLEAARRFGVRCSAGHSVATAEQTTAAVDAGLRSVTHMFNAMGPFHHRTPGIQGVALTDQRLVAEVIADGVHVHATAVQLLARAKGKDGVALVTDSIGATGLDDGDYFFEEQQVTLEDGAARLSDGTLAGSTLTMDAAVTNFARCADITWEDAVHCATAVPARLLGMADHTGAVAVGMDADLVAFTSDRRVAWTMVGGSVEFRN